MDKYLATKEELMRNPKVWLVTGVAGFIGSTLLQQLLELGQTVVGLDNFSTGYQANLDEVKLSLTAQQWARFTPNIGDICDLETCRKVVEGADYVLHQAALGSVPRSIEDPLNSNASNVSGFLNMLVAARDAKVGSFTYAASSSTYGDHEGLPKVEERIGKPLSPYAVTKYVNELYADVFARCYGFKSIGLRYFNVFGPRQDPNGAYAAVIPKWYESLLDGGALYINGDGETSRDFCYVSNVVQANILAAVADDASRNEVYNIAVGERTTLNELAHDMIESVKESTGNKEMDPGKIIKYRSYRDGDVRHSLADVSKANKMLGYSNAVCLRDGLKQTCSYFIRKRLAKP